MRCLWITRLPPYPPFYGGDAIYSSHLIEALADAGPSVTVFCLSPDPKETSDIPETAGVAWHIVHARQRRPVFSLASALPSLAYRFSEPIVRQSLAETLDDGNWDAILIDHIGMGWVIDPIVRHYRRQTCPTLVYISHNHEETTRRDVYRNFRGSLFTKFGLLIDSIKSMCLERRLAARTDFVTTITEEDQSAFARRKPKEKILVLTPGYDGPVQESPPSFREMPRRIAILGSFNWIAKRMNLEAFLALAAPSFEKAGGEILVVGDMPKTDARGLESRFKAVRVTGRVEDVGPYLKESRLGIIPERTGGGFKLKMLTYIFHRLPIACLEGSVAGLPLRAGEAFLAFPDMEHLAKGALAALDDLMLLDRLQEKAFSQCRGKHDWAERGAALAALLQLGRS